MRALPIRGGRFRPPASSKARRAVLRRAFLARWRKERGQVAPGAFFEGSLSIWLLRLGIASLVAMALGYLPYRAYDRSGLAHFLRLRSERERLHRVNLSLGEANLHLRAQLDALSDPQNPGQLSAAAVEGAARDELGLVRPGEIVFRVDPIPGHAEQP